MVHIMSLAIDGHRLHMTFVHERVSEMNLYVSHGDKSKIEGRVADVLHRKIIAMLIFIIIFNFSIFIFTPPIYTQGILARSENGISDVDILLY